MNDNLPANIFKINNNIPGGNLFTTAMSFFGQYQLVTNEYSGVYLSTDYGVTWKVALNVQGQSYAGVSRSGQYQTVAIRGDCIYTSNDFGTTWVASSAPKKLWCSVAISSTGKYQIASGQSVYISSDYGVNWAMIDATNFYRDMRVSISLTGKYQTAVINSVGILTSSDYGATWKLNNNITSNNSWIAISMSLSGQYQTAINNTMSVSDDMVYVSNDYGSTWVNKMRLVGLDLCIAISGTGKYQVLADQATSFVYESMDYGNTWTINNTWTISSTRGTNIQRFGGIAMSKDGKYITIVAYQGNVFQCFNNINYDGFPQLMYSTNLDGTADLIAYIGIESTVNIPASTIGIDNKLYTVTSIYEDTFSGYTELTSVVIPPSVISINKNAFKSSNLTNVYFLGDIIPTINTSNFSNGSDTVYYKSGADNICALSGLFTYSTITPRDPVSNVQASYSGSDILVSWTAPVIANGIVSSNLTKYIVTPYKDTVALASIEIIPVNGSLATSTQIAHIDGTSVYKFIVTSVYGTYNSTQAQSNNLVPHYIAHCFNKGTQILTDTGYRNIESLKKGDLVKTHQNGFRPITYIHKSIIDYKEINPDSSKIYKCSKENYPELFEDLLLTGWHSILVDELTQEQTEKTIQSGNKVYKVEDKWGLLSSLDKRSIPHDKYGVYELYHVAVSKLRKNKYGIYANGLLTEAYF